MEYLETESLGFLFSSFVSLFLRQKSKCKYHNANLLVYYAHRSTTTAKEICIPKCQLTYEHEWLSRINNQKHTVYRGYSLELHY